MIGIDFLMKNLGRTYKTKRFSDKKKKQPHPKESCLRRQHLAVLMN
jgi:hypothetical protein